jgi:hypothetical protein
VDPVVTVEDPDVAVEPGGQVTVRVRVRNRSSIVEGFRLDVLGEAAAWAQVHPPEVEVRPQEEAQTVVVFAPPAGTGSRAGQVAFGVRAVSRVDPTASAVAEGDLRVGSVSLSQATLTPVTSRGRFSGRHRIEMSNWGNASVRLHLEVGDPDEALGFLIVPDVLDLPIGTTGRARLKVRARKPFFRGLPVRRPFKVVGRPVVVGADGPGGPGAPGGPLPFGFDPAVPSVDGAFEQRPLLGRTVVAVAVLGLAAAGAAGYLSTRAGDDPGAEAVAPPVPEAFAAQALSHDTVRLTWQPGQRVDGYKLYTVDPSTATTPEPRASAVTDLPGDQGQIDVGDLAPATRHCYQLAAVRNEVTSARTPAGCVDTLQLAGPGSPATPSGVAVEAAGDGKVRVSWEDASAGQADHVVIRDGSIVDVVAAPRTETVVDLASGENCFQVQAQVGDTMSAASEPCVVLPGGQGGGPVAPGAGEETGETTTTAAPGGEPGPALETGVIAAVYLVPLEDDTATMTAEQRALARRDELRAQGYQAEVLNTTDYPQLANAAGNFWFVYVRGFTDLAAADQFCQAGDFPTCASYDLSPG